MRKKPALSFEVISNANVYDIHENVGKLDVIYAGQSLRANKQILRLLNFRIINSGQTSFLKNDYDESEPLGFSINGGTILELPKFTGSSDYLQAHAKPTVISSTEIRIMPLIFEPGEFIEIHALVLAREGAEPVVQPLGKLAGIKKIQVVESNQSAEHRSFWRQIVDANSIWVQIARAPVYGGLGVVMIVLLVLFIMLFIVPIDSLMDFKKKRERTAKIKMYSQGKPLSVADRHVIEMYVEDGEIGLERLIKISDRISERNILASKIGKGLEEEELKKILRSVFPLRHDRIEKMEKEGLIKRDGMVISVDSELMRALNELAEFVGVSLNIARTKYLQEDIDYHSAVMFDARKELIDSE